MMLRGATLSPVRLEVGVAGAAGTVRKLPGMAGGKNLQLVQLSYLLKLDPLVYIDGCNKLLSWRVNKM